LDASDFGGVLTPADHSSPTVTSNIAEMALALLAVGVYFAGAATVAGFTPSEGFSTGSDGLQAAVLIGVCFVTIVWQYARRKTDRSRALLASAAAAILIIVIATPYRTPSPAPWHARP
jgi:hypothetical protein